MFTRERQDRLVLFVSFVVALFALTGSARAGEVHAIALDGLPLRFEANLGQTDNQVQFLSRGRGYTLFLTSSEAVLSLRPSPAVVSWRLAGADPKAPVDALEELPGKVNSYMGQDPKRWRTNIPTYAKVRYRNIYPGIDLVYYGNQHTVEHDFVLSPGADPRKIRLTFAGADSQRVAENGDLVLRIGEKEIRFRKPDVFQEVNGERILVAGTYAEIPTRSTGVSQIGFEITAYDRSKPLIIDPILDYSTYLGGTGDDYANGIAMTTTGMDGSGNVYLAGTTSNPGSFPGPAIQGGKAIKMVPAIPDQGNASFVVKVDKKTGAMQYSTYFDGTAYGIAVSAAGVAAVAGGGSPSIPNLYKSQNLGGLDAFVLRLDTNGIAQKGAILGGSKDDVAYAVSIDQVNDTNVYITGTTYSGDFPHDHGFQTSLGAGNGKVGQTADGLNRDAFIANLDFSQANPLIYASYMGGTSIEDGFAIAGNGAVAVAGQTCSNNFPTPQYPPYAASAFQTSSKNQNCNAFVAVVAMCPNNNLNCQVGDAILQYSSYLGGSGWDLARSISIGPIGSSTALVITGETTSPDFPTSTNGYKKSPGGGYDVFVTELFTGGGNPPPQPTCQNINNPVFNKDDFPTLNNCADLGYSTFLGGTGDDYGYGVGGSPSGIYVTGQTCPVANSPDKCDAFVTKFNPSGVADFTTTLGGSDFDLGKGVVVDLFGTAYVTGWTTSSDFPKKSLANAYNQPSSGGGVDSFIARFSKTCPGGGGPYAYLLPQVIDTANDCPAGSIMLNAGETVVVRPDGAKLFTGDGTSTVNFVDLTTVPIQVTPVTIPNSSQESSGMAVSPDGTRLYVMNHKDTHPKIFVFDTDTNQLVDTITFNDGQNLVGGGLIVHPDGKRLLSASYHGASLLVIDISTSPATLSKIVDLGIPGNGRPTGIALTPDGHWAYLGVNTAFIDANFNYYGGVAVVDVSTPGMETWTGKNILFPDPQQGVAITPTKVEPYKDYLIYVEGGVLNNNNGSPQVLTGRTGGDYAAVTPDGLKVYVPTYTVAKVIDAASSNWLDSVPALGQPSFGDFIGPQDRDGDGINDQFDGTFQGNMFVPDPNISDSFTDQYLPSGTSYGKIFDRGGGNGKVAIWHAFPTGFYARASGGDHAATVDACNQDPATAPNVSIKQGEVKFICGSLTLQAISGEAKVNLGSGVFAKVTSGSSIKVTDVSGTTHLDNLGNTTITLVNSTDQTIGSVSPGQSYTTAVAPNVTCTSAGPFTYDRKAHPVTCTASTTGGATVSGSWAYSYTPSAGTSGPVNAGSYNLTASFTSGDPGYTNTGVTLTVTINPKPASVTPNAASKNYGDPDPALSGILDGFIAGDGITATYARTVGEDVAGSPYKVSATLGPAGALGNYSITYNSANFTINPAPLTITANNATKLLGAPNPAFSATYSGFVRQESPQVLQGTLTFNTTAAVSSPVGKYLVTPGGVSSGNYAIRFVPGTLTITYSVCVLYDQTKPVNSGATIPIKLQLCSAAGANQSSSAIVLVAQKVTQLSTNISSAPIDAGNANPDQDFRFDATLGPGYIYNLKTTGLTTGTYKLTFSVMSDPLTHDVQFQVK